MTKRRRFGRIRQLPSRRWQVRYPDGAGRLISAPETFATSAAAERCLASIETDQRRGEWTDPRLGRRLFGDFAAEWWRTTVDLRPSTRVRDEGYVNRYVLPRFGDCMLAEITQLDVRGWVADLSSTLAPATVVKAARLLGKILTAAVDGRLIAVSPCKPLPLPRIEQHEMRFLSPAEVADLSDAIDPRYRALVLVGAFAGLRIGELAGLKRSRVDLLRRRIDVAEVCVEAEGHLYFGPPKTRAGRRQVPIPRQVADELAMHIEHWAGPELVFTAPEGGPLRAGSWRRRFWQPAVARAGLAPLRPHDLRHTAVALWIAEDANPKHIAALAGHTSVSFTLDRYGHLFPAADDELMARLDRAYAPVPAVRDGARKGHDVISPLRRDGSA
ncbi:MAG: site-specific integrase [Acidimicrobiales bacterium]